MPPSGNVLHSAAVRRGADDPDGALPDTGVAAIKSPAAPVPAGPLAVHAATATSTRRRNEPNAYNLIIVRDGGVELEVHAWDGRTLFAAVKPVAAAKAIETDPVSPA